MDSIHLILLFFAVGVIAFLYSSVGHAGASGYIATMTLFGVAPTVIRPTALVLNILVASIGTFQFWRAGWLLYKGSFDSFAGSRPRSSCDNWRDCGIAFGQQAFCCAGDFVFIGDSPSYRRDETAFHEMTRRARLVGPPRL